MAYQQGPEILGQKPAAESQSVVIASDQSAIPVSGSFTMAFTDTNYGTPTADSQRVAAMLGLGSTAVSNANPVPVSDAGGSLTIDGTVAATQSGTWAVNISDSAGGVLNSTGGSLHVSVTNGTLAVTQSGTWTVVTSSFPATVDTDYGVPGASTLRSAAMLGVGSTAVSNGNPVPVSDAGGSLTVDGTVAATQSGAWSVSLVDVTRNSGAADLNTLRVAVSTDSTISAENFPTTVDIDLGAPGVSTLRTAAMLGVGSTAVSNANPVPMSDAGGSITVDGTVATSNFPATVDTNTGAAGASTIRTVLATRHEAAATPLSTRQSDGTNFYLPSTKGRARVSLVTNLYSSVNVTTAAYVELIASTAAEINRFHVFDSSGSLLVIATGAAAAEVDQFYIFPGGLDAFIDFNVPSGTRVSIKAVDTNATTGRLAFTALS
jgi:hypothetical protein